MAAARVRTRSKLTVLRPVPALTSDSTVAERISASECRGISDSIAARSVSRSARIAGDASEQAGDPDAG
jgi:hypothetical protein